MQTRVGKWGHSLAVRIPTSVAREMALDEGKQVQFSVEAGRLVIEPITKRRRYSLEELVAGITDENRHEEVDWGPPVGKEFG